MDARADAPAIGFELGFAGSARADAAAEPRQRVAGADQPRQQVFQLRELDLQLALARPRAAREDVEDQLRAIDDLAADLLLDLPQLRRRQLVVEDDDVDVGFGARRGERLDLAGAEKGRRIGLRPLLQHAQHDLGAGRLGQAGQLVERSLGLEPPRAAGDQADERRALASGYARRSLAACPAMPESRPTQSRRRGPAAARRRVTSTIVDGGPPRRRPGVEQQIDAIAQRALDLVRIRGRRLAADVRARRGDRPPHAAQTRPRDRVRRHADADRARAAASPRARSARGAATSSVSGPGQKRAASRCADRRRARPGARRPARASAAISGSARFDAAPLHSEHPRHRVAVERIGGQSVQRVGRQRDDAAVENPLGGFLIASRWGAPGSTNTRRIDRSHEHSSASTSTSCAS